MGEARVNFDLSSVKKSTLYNFNVCGYPKENSRAFVEKRVIDLGFGPISTAGHYVVSGYRYNFENLEKDKKYKIVQYQDGEVILFDTSSAKKIILTSNARKYLKMKNSAGGIVPINDVTLKKYQTLSL